MNYDETLSFIHSLGMFSHPASLERITALLKALGDPQNSFDAVHIAGTNGKGSTAAFCSSVFRTAGLKTGLFVSPFIIDFTERIQINGAFIPRKRLCELVERVRETGIAVTEFEFITAVAFLYFAEEKCDIAVIETGLGGRLDATNALTRKRVSVITKIGLDHTAILGPSLGLIAAEKCGIVKGGEVVSAPRQPRAAMRVIREHAPQVTVPDMRRVRVKNCSPTGNEFTYKGEFYRTFLGGAHQIENAVTAIEAVVSSGLVNDNETIRKGLENARFPARLEVFGTSPLIILDGAHNPDGAAVLEHAMRAYGNNITAVVGMMKDKNCNAFLKKVLPHCRRVIAVRASASPRSLDETQMAQLAEKYCSEVSSEADIETAVERAIAAAGDGTVFIFGSLYLASAVRPILIDR